ncbi:MAG: hypothetical protein HRU09_11040 [Oligoflexales bacterium]|nr:hypothetical protein [Oligoflexales bacterium]
MNSLLNHVNRMMLSCLLLCGLNFGTLGYGDIINDYDASLQKHKSAILSQVMI